MLLWQVHDLLKSILVSSCGAKSHSSLANGIYTPQSYSVIGQLGLGLWQSVALSYEGMTSCLLICWGFLTKGYMIYIRRTLQ